LSLTRADNCTGFTHNPTIDVTPFPGVEIVILMVYTMSTMLYHHKNLPNIG